MVTKEEEKILEGFQWSQNEIVLHSDTTVRLDCVYALFLTLRLGVAARQGCLVCMELRYPFRT